MNVESVDTRGPNEIVTYTNIHSYYIQRKSLKASYPRVRSDINIIFFFENKEKTIFSERAKLSFNGNTDLGIISPDGGYGQIERLWPGGQAFEYRNERNRARPASPRAGDRPRRNIEWETLEIRCRARSTARVIERAARILASTRTTANTTFGQSGTMGRVEEYISSLLKIANLGYNRCLCGQNRTPFSSSSRHAPRTSSGWLVGSVRDLILL